MKLYFNPVSIFSQKVIMAFCEKGISYDAFNVELGNPERKKEDRAIYPLGKVPTVQTAEMIMGESTSIVEWLDEIYSDNSRAMLRSAQT